MTIDSCPPSANPSEQYPGDCEFTQFLRERAQARHGGKTGPLSRQACLNRAKDIKLLLLDVDGVLTDGSITYTNSGDEIKTFHCRDGFGMNMLQKIGVEIGLITARRSEALERRARDLKLTHVFQGTRRKMEVFNTLLNQLQFTPQQVAFMGDDWLDLPVLTQVGLAATVADGAPELLPVVDFVSTHPGGHGAVRDLCDLIIEAQGRRQDLLNEYMTRQ
ncbi:MAG: HAD hydrolase family protein [Proteobacteria bacterium]|nr:3-deoxy-D-manno-octulosonate 8-phosphate phosphatase [Desulfobulbaceae bacterium]MBU4153528.1 HAD hydrolase family protein [Pseudomonadota bacterium]MDP2106731.1 HAD hydrolase family protein [Desulfobulbaceae bacterium]